MKEDFDADELVPRGRESFSLRELAKLFCCSVQHLWNLIEEKEIDVPQENIDRAKSRSTIQVPRAGVVDFLRPRVKRVRLECANGEGSGAYGC